MITHIGTVSLFVSDQDRASEFYVNKVGFQKRRDDPMGPPGSPRWLEVAPPGAQTAIVLYQPTPEMPGASTYEGAMQNIGTFAPSPSKWTTWTPPIAN